MLHRVWSPFHFLLQGSKVYRYKCLPFGADVAPLLLTTFMKVEMDKVLEDCADLIAQHSIVILVYLDDILVFGLDHQAVLQVTTKVRLALTALGFFMGSPKNPKHPWPTTPWLGKHYGLPSEVP